jgi:hypothetical protein
MGAMSAFKSIPEGTRTLNLWLRKPTPYPFGHRDVDPKVRSRGIEPRPPAWKAGILATELRTLKCYKPSTGVEPVTSRLLSECSNQLSYEGRYGESGFRSPCLVVANDALYRLS